MHHICQAECLSEKSRLSSMTNGLQIGIDRSLGDLGVQHLGRVMVGLAWRRRSVASPGAVVAR